MICLSRVLFNISDKYAPGVVYDPRPALFCVSGRFYSRIKETPQSPHITLTSRVARMIVPHSGQTYLILRFLDLLPPFFPFPLPSGRRAAWIASSPKASASHAVASAVRVVIVQPYLSCFSMIRPWASAVL